MCVKPNVEANLNVIFEKIVMGILLESKFILIYLGSILHVASIIFTNWIIYVVNKN